jgi:hypothetical protein
MMDTFNILSNANIEFDDPIKYSSIFQKMVLNSTSCLDRDEYRVQPSYSVFQEYIAALAMSHKYPSSDKDTNIIQFYADLRYSDKEHVWDRVSYGVDISVLKDSIIIIPYLDLLYINLKSRLALVTSKIHTKENNTYTFYKVYDIIYTSIKKFMVEEHSDILDTIKKIDESSDKILEEMAILTTLVYMKHIVPKNKYEEFMELEGKNIEICTSVDTTKAMYEINKSLFEIGSRDPKLLDDTIYKIRYLIDKAGK